MFKIFIAFISNGRAMMVKALLDDSQNGLKCLLWILVFHLELTF